MAVDVRKVFDDAAADYDRLRRQLVPHFDDFYGTALERIPYMQDAEFRVLDLGAGTGLLTAMIGVAFPYAHLTLADISAGMLARARERFANRDDVEYLTLDLEREPLIGRYDVAVSALALHHVAPASLVSVFRRVYDVLESGGIFINADQTLGTSAGNEQIYGQAWEAAVRKQGSTVADIHAAYDRMKADQTATLEDQLGGLREAGFTEVDCWYKRYRFAVYSGRKP